MAKRIALSLFVLAPGLAFAQTGPTTERVRGAEALEARCGGEVRVRWNAETGTPANLSFTKAASLAGTSPVDAAAGWLQRDLAPLFEGDVTVVTDPRFAPATGPALVLTEVRSLGNGRVRVDFEQRSGPVPVLDAGVSVELATTRGGFAPIAVRARYSPDVPADMGNLGPMPADAKIEEGFAPVRVGDLTVDPTCTRQVVPVDGGHRLACVVQAVLPETGETWRIVFDAQTTEELSRSKLTCNATAQGLAYDKNPGETARANVPLTDLYVFSGNNRLVTDANGNHNGAGTVSLNDGLAGPLLRVFVSGEEELIYSGPANIALAPQEGSSQQDELAAWHNILDFNKHLKTVYPRFAASNAINTRFAILVRYKQNGRPLANAFFSPGQAQAGGDTFRNGYIAMGTFGGREAARSSSVCQHEYCHALFQQIVSLSGSLEAGGLNEGLADYLPAAFKNDPRLGFWLTGNGIRDLRTNFVWPRDNNGGVHRVGHIFAGALWDAREAAEARTRGASLQIDQAVVEGIFRLRNRPSLTDARDAILDGDGAVNGGAFRVTLARAFNDHGIGPAPNNGRPAFVGLAPTSVRVGETLTLTVQTSDPDGDPVLVTASPVANASYDDATGTWTFTPAATQQGTVQVTFTGSDEELSASETITVDVDPPLSAPPPPPTPGGGVAPVTSSGAPAAARGGGGGGGGCSLGGDATPAGGGAMFLVLLALLGLARRRV